MVRIGYKVILPADVWSYTGREHDISYLVSRSRGKPRIVHDASVSLWKDEIIRVYLEGTGEGLHGKLTNLIDAAAILRKHADGITNEANIYDKNDGTYGYPGSSLAAGEVREVAVWDLGAIKDISLWVRHQIYYSGDASRILHSTDDVTYTLVSEVVGAGKWVTKEKWAKLTTRYLKWECEYGTAGINTQYRLLSLEAWDSIAWKPLNIIEDYKAATDETITYVVLYDKSATINYAVLKLVKVI